MQQTVQKAPLSKVKAMLSDFVDQAEHYGRATIILRHGKPAAVLIPVPEPAPKSKRMSRIEAKALLARLSNSGDPNLSAVKDLMEGRR